VSACECAQERERDCVKVCVCRKKKAHEKERAHLKAVIIPGSIVFLVAITRRHGRQLLHLPLLFWQLSPLSLWSFAILIACETEGERV
jgi:hypothetical protein